MRSMQGIVAVVTGASRGAGRGIAQVLGEHGATVYVTGRSVRGLRTQPQDDATIERTAELVSARGGTGIAVHCDHTDDQAITQLFERVGAEQGGIDLLVNNAWGGYENHDSTFDAPFWEQPIARFDRMLNAGLRSNLVTTRAALSLLWQRPHALIVNTTLEMDTTFYDRSLFYRTVKVAINYMTFGMAVDLQQHPNSRVAAIALAPGWMRTEAVLHMFERGEYTPDQSAQTESPEFIGRAIVALWHDPQLMKRSGQTLRSRDLAREYGFADIDGRQPV